MAIKIFGDPETAAAAEGLILIAVIAAVAVLILLALVFDRIETIRFRRWCNNYGMTEPPVVPWRTIVPWHRTGSKWYLRGCEALGAGVVKRRRINDPFQSGMNGGFGRGFGNAYGGFHRGDRRGGGRFGDGRGNAAQNYGNGNGRMG